MAGDALRDAIDTEDLVHRLAPESLDPDDLPDPDEAGVGERLGAAIGASVGHKLGVALGERLIDERLLGAGHDDHTDETSEPDREAADVPDQPETPAEPEDATNGERLKLHGKEIHLERTEDLDELSYRELQRIAKQLDIKANQKREEMAADIADDLDLAS